MRNPYWFNVTRFFAGCFSKGEQPGLAERLLDLNDDAEYRLTPYPRLLAAALLGDWVFAQSNRSLKAVVALMTTGGGFRQTLFAEGNRRAAKTPLTLPEGSGRAELLDRCFDIILSDPEAELWAQAARIAQGNAGEAELLARFGRLLDAQAPDSNRLVQVAARLGILSRLSEQNVRRLLSGDDLTADAVTAWLLSRGSVELPVSEERAQTLIDMLLDGGIHVMTREPQHDDIFLRLATLLSPLGYLAGGRWLGGMTLAEARDRLGPSHRPRPESVYSHGAQWDLPSEVKDVLAHAAAYEVRDVREWRNTVEPWDGVVEPLRKVYGDRWALIQLAVVAGIYVSHVEAHESNFALHDPALTLAHQAALSRARAGNLSWWRRQAESSNTAPEKLFWLALALTFAGPKVLQGLSEHINEAVTRLQPADREMLQQGLYYVNFASSVRQGRRLEVRTLPPDLAADTVHLLANRCDPHTRVKLAARFDATLRLSATGRQFLVDVAQQRLLEGDGAAWSVLVEIAESLHKDQSESLDLGMGNRRLAQMPVDVAKKIASSPGEFPASLLVIAQARCQQQLHERVEPLARIADREGWFEQHSLEPQSRATD